MWEQGSQAIHNMQQAFTLQQGWKLERGSLILPTRKSLHYLMDVQLQDIFNFKGHDKGIWDHKDFFCFACNLFYFTIFFSISNKHNRLSYTVIKAPPPENIYADETWEYCSAKVFVLGRSNTLSLIQNFFQIHQRVTTLQKLLFLLPS